MELGLIGCTDRADYANRPEDSKSDVAACPREYARVEAEAVERQESSDERHQYHQAKLRLEPPCSKVVLEDARAPPRDRDQHALEDALALEATEIGWPFLRMRKV